MKEKILKKETTKTETEEIVSQETLCENLYNLSSSLGSLDGFDAAALGEDAKLQEARLNILLAIHFQSTYLQTQE
jgi:hypothetical protein